MLWPPGLRQDGGRAGLLAGDVRTPREVTTGMHEVLQSQISFSTMMMVEDGGEPDLHIRERESRLWIFHVVIFRAQLT